MLKEIQGVVFDLDGTLIDSMGLWGQVDVDYLARYGLEVPEGLQEDIEGLSVIQTAQYFQETFGIEDSIEQMIADWNDMAFLKYRQEVSLKEGVLEFLDYLQSQNIVCGIATSNTSELAETALLTHGILDAFEVVITGEDIENGKPGPDIYLEAAARLGVLPENCLVFEDIPAGIIAGRAAGMKVCAVEDDYSIKDTYMKRKLADYYIRSYADVLDGTYETLGEESERD